MSAGLRGLFRKARKLPVRIAAGTVLFIPGLIFEKTGHPVPALILCLASTLICGADVIIGAVKGLLHGELIDEKFLMTVAAAGAFALGDFSEAAAVMIFYQIGEYFQSRAVRSSRNSIKELMDICPDDAVRIAADGSEERIDAEELAVGDLIVLRGGERVPADSEVIEGSADLDTSALTGESLPRQIGAGDRIESGTVVLTGTVRARVERECSQSAAARILELVENASESKSAEENFITKFARVYTPAVVAGAVMLAVIPPLFGLTTFADSIKRALVFLVVSCPCALILSVPLAFFGGIGRAASSGILFKGGNCFSPVARADTFVFDKTGTLTTGKLSVLDAFPVGVSRDELLSLAGAAEYSSLHPIAQCLREYAPDDGDVRDCVEIPGKGCAATVGGKRIFVGNAAMMAESGASVPSDAPVGGIFVSRDGEYIGAVTFTDCTKPEAKSAIEALHRIGVGRTVILSGDKKENAERVRSELGIDSAEAELLPAQKYESLERIMDSGKGKTVYVGDGINDAPSLARADAGIAMGGIGSDSAIESADVVIVSDNLSKLAEAVLLARKSLRIARENIVLAIGVKLLVLILGSLGLAGMWHAVFADVGVAVIAVLNSMRTLSKKTN